MTIHPKLRSALGVARRVATTARDLFPLSPLGVITLASAAWALVHFGYFRSDILFCVIGGVALGLGILAILVSAATSIALYFKHRRRQGMDPLRLECGFAARTGFSTSNLWFVPIVKVSWSWVSPDAQVRQISLHRRYFEEITPARRGIHEAIVRRFEVSDAFGLTRIAFVLREERAVRFVPSVGSLKQMHVVRSIAGGDATAHPDGPPDGERADMRHYNPGDPIKFILWKVFARSRQLVVRTPERAISPVRQTVAYLVSGDGDEPAAGAARVAVDSGALGGEWVLGADGNDVNAKTSTQALEVLARSANTPREMGGAGLSTFLSKATTGGVGRAVVFVPARPGPWLDKVIAAARARTTPNQQWSPVEFVVCTDGISRAPKTSWWSRVAFRQSTETVSPTVTPPTAAADVNAVVNALSSARARVLIVDRLAGRVYAEGHRRALEAP